MKKWKEKIKNAKWCFYIYDYKRTFGKIDILINKDKSKFFIDLDNNLYFTDNYGKNDTFFEIDKIFLFEDKDKFVEFILELGLPKNDDDYEMLVDCEIDNKTIENYKQKIKQLEGELNEV